MSDRPTTPAEPPNGPDPAVTAALRSMVPPQHGYGFWADFEAALAAEPPSTTAVPTVALPPQAPPPTTALPTVALPPQPAPPPPPPLPPVAEVVPLPPPRRPLSQGWWIAGAAAALLAVFAVAALVATATTDVTTKPAATSVPVVPTTVAPPSTTARPSTTRPATTLPAAPATTAAPRTTTTASRPVSLTLSPDGLGPLRFGMTTDVAKATGAVGAYAEPLGPACGSAGPTGFYQSGDFSALFVDYELVRFYVAPGSRLRTPQGVGVGSALSKLSSVPGTRTEGPHPYGPGTNVQIMTGDVGYLFTVENGTVKEWSVGTTDGLSLPEGCA